MLLFNIFCVSFSFDFFQCFVTLFGDLMSFYYCYCFRFVIQKFEFAFPYKNQEETGWGDTIASFIFQFNCSMNKHNCFFLLEPSNESIYYYRPWVPSRDGTHSIVRKVKENDRARKKRKRVKQMSKTSLCMYLTMMHEKWNW